MTCDHANENPNICPCPVHCICRNPGQTCHSKPTILPGQWNCPHCGYGEYKKHENWLGRMSDHIEQCPSKPKPKPKRVEAIDHPSHYGGADNPFEHIKVVNALGWGYHIGNCTKYLWRAGRKDSSKLLEDLKKARWYLDEFIKLMESK